MPRRAIIFLIIFAAALSLYIYTLAPGWGPVNIFNTWDGLEYLLCSQTGGIDHPPGHPLYLILAKIFTTLLPLFSIQQRMTLFSAFFGALAAGLIYLLVELALRVIAKARDKDLTDGAAIVTALTFAASKVFWTHCLIIEVHTLYLFLSCVLFYSILRSIEDDDLRWPYLSFFTSGLLISTSIMNALTLILPALLVQGIVKASSRKNLALLSWGKAILLFLAGASFYIYYPLVMLRGPAFVHPMNLITSWPLGSAGWYGWFLSGRAWTGEGMFSLGRVFTNLPNFLVHNIDNFSFLTFIVFVLSFGYGIFLILKERFSKTSLAFLLFLLCYVCVAVPQLSLQDVSNPGSSTYIYVANFFLPSFIIYIIIAGIGLGAMLDYIAEKELLKKAFDLFNVPRTDRQKKIAVLLLLYFLFALPFYLMAVNYGKCNLKEENTGYNFARGIMQMLPDRSVVYSKLVFELTCAYFTKIEPILAGKSIVVQNPDVIAKDINSVQYPGIAAMIKRTELFKSLISGELSSGNNCYIAGDCVDEDKAPETLLISDLRLLPRIPVEGYVPGRPFPTELIPYQVMGIRKGQVFFGTPKIEAKGISNDGNFADTIELLGYSTASEGELPHGRQKMSIDLYWEALNAIPEDLVGLFMVFDERLNRIDPAATSGFFSLGGEYPSSRWKMGSTIKDRAYFYLPQLSPGRYFLALGLLKENGESVQYFPSNDKERVQRYDFILLLPFSIGQRSNI